MTTTVTGIQPALSNIPPAPATYQEAGLSLDLLIQLTLKILHFAGELSGVDLGRRLGVNFSVIEPALEFLKTQRQVEISGGTMMGRGSYRYRITDAGRQRAALFLESNHYVGVAPVPFDQYQAYMRGFAKTAPRSATRDRVREAFSHLVIGQSVLDQLGPAINAGHSMFVYGPPGNGKTVISQAIRKLLHGTIAIPHAIEVEGSIIRFFDPVNHEPIESVRRCRGSGARPRRPGRSPLGALPASDGDGRRRADARGAGAELQRDHRVLPGAGPGRR